MYQGEKFNSVTHLIGSALAIAGLSILVTIAVLQDDVWKVVSFSIYGSTLVLLYGFSTIYHTSAGIPQGRIFVKSPRWRKASLYSGQLVTLYFGLVNLWRRFSLCL